MNFPQQLKNLREQRGLTQRQLGEMINVSDATINRYEKGLRNPDPETLNILANIFNTTIDFLLGRDAKEYIAPCPATDAPTEDLPPEALKEIEEFKAFVRHKYKDYSKGKGLGKNRE